jgi:hypothetical protein
MEFEMSDLQCDISTGGFSIAKCLYQPMDRVYRCLELTDIKVYRLLCLQESTNIRWYSVDVEHRSAIRNCEKRLLQSLGPSVCPSFSQH